MEPSPTTPPTKTAPATPAPGRRTTAREGLVLAVSALVVLVGTLSATRSPSPTLAPGAAVPGASVGMPPPLPSGAPMREFEELPADDERYAGCHFNDRGFGDYEEWRKVPGGRALVPVGRALASDGTFPLLVHFHGAEPVRKMLAPEGFNLVIAAVDAGVGSQAYDRAFQEAAAFEQIVAAVESEVARVNGYPSARAQPIALSSWSAGYGAVRRILARDHSRIGAVVLLDSLYSGYAPGQRTVERASLDAFVEAARAAQSGGPVFYLTHTAIPTPGYASTAEVASFLLGELGVQAARVDGDQPNHLARMFEQGHLWIRGYGGADRDAHCAALHLLPGILRESVLPTWRR